MMTSFDILNLTFVILQLPELIRFPFQIQIL